MRPAPLFLLAALIFASDAARAEILVGLAGPMTGPDAPLGDQVRRGGEKAIADLNAAGGLLDQKIASVVGDDACDPKQAVNVANDLAERKVAVVIGHVCSSASIPASNVYAEANILQISPASTNPQLTERGLANVFRVCGRDDSQGPTAAAYVLTHFPLKTVAVVDDKQTYGRGIALAFKDRYVARTAKEPLYQEIAAGEKDYSALVTKLKAAGIELIYYGGYFPEAALILRQAHDQDYRPILIGGDGLNDPQFAAIAGDAAEGALMTFGPDPKTDPANRDLVRWFVNDGYPPEAYTLYTYAALQVWSGAVARAGSLATDKVVAAIRSNKFQTALGTLAFNIKGDLNRPGFVVYVWKNGRPVYAE